MVLNRHQELGTKELIHFFMPLWFKKCASDHGLYVKTNDYGDLLILCWWYHLLSCL